MTRSALGDPDCDRCQRAPSGVCFTHAGATAAPAPDDARRCTGVKVDGTRCLKWAQRGNDMCLTHDKKRRGAYAQAATTSGRNLSISKIRQAAIDHLRMKGVDRPVIDPLEELESLSAEAIALKDWFRTRLVEEMNVPKGEDVNWLEFEARLSLYTAALERAATLVTGYGKHGLEKRLVELREEVTGVLTGVFNRLLAEFVPADRQAAAQVLLAETVQAIDVQSREVS